MICNYNIMYDAPNRCSFNMFVFKVCVSAIWWHTHNTSTHMTCEVGMRVFLIKLNVTMRLDMCAFRRLMVTLIKIISRLLHRYNARGSAPRGDMWFEMHARYYYWITRTRRHHVNPDTCRCLTSWSLDFRFSEAAAQDGITKRTVTWFMPPLLVFKSWPDVTTRATHTQSKNFTTTFYFII